jgi:hypothetical protein
VTGMQLGTPMRSRFHDIDDLVLRLKGLALVRELRERGGAEPRELEMFDSEIDHVREKLVELVENSRVVERAAA